MYDAINKGDGLASGQIFGYLNADDVYMPWAIEAALHVLAAQPEVDLVFGDGIRVDDFTGRQELRLFGPVDARKLVILGSLMQPAVFWRRSLVDRIGGFDADLRYVGDLDFWLRALGPGRAAHIPEILAVERVHPGALSSAHAEAMASEDEAMRARHRVRLGVRDEARALQAARREWKVDQRRRWLAFLAAWSAGPRKATRWRRFIGDGRTHVSRARILLGMLPRCGPRFLPGAVRSDLASELLGVGDAG